MYRYIIFFRQYVLRKCSNEKIKMYTNNNFIIYICINFNNIIGIILTRFIQIEKIINLGIKYLKHILKRIYLKKNF
jgi:hypothetical protein